MTSNGSGGSGGSEGSEDTGNGGGSDRRARITAVDAWEVLDSRGHPTVRVAVETDGARGVFTVPAGASTGSHEAVERRDRDDRYGGRGVRGTVADVCEELAPVVTDRDATDQAAIDRALVECDGTNDLSRLGANAVLGVSGAVVHAAAAALDEPLHVHLASLADRATDATGCLPMPTVNVLSGGLHARGGIEVQDFLVVPIGAASYPEALHACWQVRAAVRERIVADGNRPLVADEGGFAPSLRTIDAAFSLLASATRDAGFEVGADIGFAVDVAATHFHDRDTGEYVLDSLDRSLDREGMIDLVVGWAREHPLVSIEDPLAEDDWRGWERLAEALPPETLLLGDDLIATNPDRLDRAIETGGASAVLVKPNQAGTITRTIEVLDTAQAADLATVVSARSGETADTTIADLAVGCGGDFIKIGSLARSERLAKYNRLTEIDRESPSLEFVGPLGGGI